MPESHTTTRTIAFTQQGMSNNLLLTWTEGSQACGNQIFFSAIQGLRYQLYDDPSLEKTRIRSLTLTLPVEVNEANMVLDAVDVAMETTISTAAFSAANPPILPTANLAGTGWVSVGTDDGTGWSAVAPPATISIPLGTLVTDPAVGTTLYSLESIAGTIESFDSTGIINLSVIIASTGLGLIADVVDPTLAVEELSFFTGVSGAMGQERGDSRVRVALDSRYGMPTWTDELVENEFIEGYWVRASDHDPEDPYRTYVPNPREGVRDDDVPLE